MPVQGPNIVVVPPTATPFPVKPAPTGAPPTNGLIDMAPPPPQPVTYVDPNATTNQPSDSALSSPMSSLSGLLHRNIVYQYDNLNRLTGAQYQDSNVDTYDFAYTYD